MDIPNEHFTDPNYIKLLYKSHVDIHNLLVKNNIAYWSSGGTTLGAVRHQGIIQWDNDLDYEISHRDVSFLMSKDFKSQLKKKGYGIKYHKEHNSTEKYDWVKIYSFIKVKGKKADIDLFPVYFDQDDTGKFRTFFSSKLVNKIWPKAYLYLDELLPLKTLKFGDGFMIVPNKAKKYLTRLFGKSWSRVGYITQDANDHYELDEPIKVKTKGFFAAKKFSSAKRQIKLDKRDPLITLLGYGF